MGGRPKGLLVAPDGLPIVLRWRRLLEEAGLRVVLVGNRPEYAPLGLPTLDDAQPGSGPLGGLVALLSSGGEAIAVACDMPHVSNALLHRLLTESPGAGVLAPRIDGVWQPLFARYDAARVLPVARKRLAEGRLALQGLLDEAGATPLSLSSAEEAELTDWDRPQDVTTSPTTGATPSRPRDS